MVWYYRDSDQEIGPVSKAELHNLIKAKQVSAKTLVRSVEMADWIPLIDVVRGNAGQPQSPPDAADTSMAEAQNFDMTSDAEIGELSMENKNESAQAKNGDQALAEAQDGDAPEMTICSQCGRTFPEDQVIAFEDRMICAACKPMFVQRLKEGVALPLTAAYGGFWIRVVAYILDAAVLGIVSWAIMIPTSMFFMPSMMQNPDQVPSAGFFIVFGLYFFFSIGLPIFYFTFFHGRWGATVGKMACGLKVVTAEGEKITYMRAFGRYFATIISGMILAIGYIMVGFDDEKRSLHDRICSTRVVKKR